jgi:hypothetical protein
MLRERRANVKKMRKKKRQIKKADSKSDESVLNDKSSPKDCETTVEIVNMPVLPPPQSKSGEPKASLYGGVFGRNKKSKKEIELEEAMMATTGRID